MTGKQGNGPFLGQSKNAFNVVGMYERNGIYARLAYNWRDKFLAESPYRSTQHQLWVAPLKTLDLSLGYELKSTLDAMRAEVRSGDARLERQGKGRFLWLVVLLLGALTVLVMLALGP